MVVVHGSDVGALGMPVLPFLGHPAVQTAHRLAVKGARELIRFLRERGHLIAGASTSAARSPWAWDSSDCSIIGMDSSLRSMAEDYLALENIVIISIRDLEAGGPDEADETIPFFNVAMNLYEHISDPF